MAPHTTNTIGAYLRVSSEEQREQGTIATQRAAIDRWLAVSSELATFYADDGISGMVPLGKRPSGARLMADVHAGRITAVVCWRLDRIGRSAPGILAAVEAIRNAGVNLVSITENFDLSTPAGVLQCNMLAAIAQFERESILQRAGAGVARRLLSTAWMGGAPPYGYAVQGKKRDARLIIDDTPDSDTGYAEADVYRLCWHLLVEQDLCVEQIARRLVSMGILARHGGVFHPVHLHRMLTNPQYSGERTYTDKAGTVHVHPIPALISREQYERAQRVLHAHTRDARATATGTTPALLRGLVRCAECGAKYTTNSTRNQALAYRERDGRWRFYQCATKLLRSRFYRRNAPDGPRDCIGMNVGADELEGQVWGDIVGWAEHPGPLLAELAAQYADAHEQTESARAEVANVAQERAALQGERDRVIRLYRTGIMTEADIDHQLAELSAADTALQKRLDAAEMALVAGEGAEAGIDGARRVLAALRAEMVAGPLSEARRREVVESLVREIVVYTVPDGISTRGREKYTTKARVVYQFERPDGGDGGDGDGRHSREQSPDGLPAGVPAAWQGSRMVASQARRDGERPCDSGR